MGYCTGVNIRGNFISRIAVFPLVREHLILRISDRSWIGTQCTSYAHTGTYLLGVLYESITTKVTQICPFQKIGTFFTQGGLAYRSNCCKKSWFLVEVWKCCSTHAVSQEFNFANSLTREKTWKLMSREYLLLYSIFITLAVVGQYTNVAEIPKIMFESVLLIKVSWVTAPQFTVAHYKTLQKILVIDSVQIGTPKNITDMIGGLSFNFHLFNREGSWEEKIRFSSLGSIDSSPGLK